MKTGGGEKTPSAHVKRNTFLFLLFSRTLGSTAGQDKKRNPVRVVETCAQPRLLNGPNVVGNIDEKAIFDRRRLIV